MNREEYKQARKKKFFDKHYNTFKKFATEGTSIPDICSTLKKSPSSVHYYLKALGLHDEWRKKRGLPEKSS